MTKEERRNLLQKMIDANENMAPGSPDNALIYATCLVSLCGNSEYKNAEAIWKYESERENLEAIEQQWGQYVLDLEQPDSHSDMLYDLLAQQQIIVNSLFGASEMAYDYFLGIANDDRKMEPMDV
jgi:hypothetical protein